MRKIFASMTAVSLFAMFLFVVSPPNAQADFSGWATCDVLMAGTIADAEGNSYVRLTDQGGAFTNRFFLLNYDVKKEMLATALTAISLDKPARVRISYAEPYSIITHFYLFAD